MSQHEVKEHLKRNKNVYISIGCSVLIAGITGAMMRNSIAQRGMCEDVAQRGTVNTASHFSFGNRQIVTITTVFDRGGRGHPGWPVRNLETGTIFSSQRAAASAFDIKEGILSGHLTGKFPDAAGLHFERINLGVPS